MGGKEADAAQGNFLLGLPLNPVFGTNGLTVGKNCGPIRANHRSRSTCPRGSSC